MMVFIAAAVASQVPRATLSMMALAWLRPSVAAAAIAVLLLRQGWRSSRTAGAVELSFLAALVAQLRSGSSLRAAMTSVRMPDGVDPDRVERNLRAGMPLGETMAHLAKSMPVSGPLVVSALDVAERSGGQVLPALEAAVLLVADHAELERERAVGTAQARVAVLVVGVVPLIAGVIRLIRPGGEGHAPAIVLAGVVLTGCGLASMVLLMRRALR